MKIAALSVFALVGSASAFAPAGTTQRTSALNLKSEDIAKYGAAAAAAGFMAAGLVQPAAALTKSQINELSYLQVKGTGLANRSLRSSVRTPSLLRLEPA